MPTEVSKRPKRSSWVLPRPPAPADVKATPPSSARDCGSLTCMGRMQVRTEERIKLVAQNADKDQNLGNNVFWDGWEQNWGIFFAVKRSSPCFTAAGPGQLTINPSVYQRVLEEHEWPSVRRLKLKRIHDNDPKHQSSVRLTCRGLAWSRLYMWKKKQTLKGLVAERIVVNFPQAAMRDWWVARSSVSLQLLQLKGGKTQTHFFCRMPFFRRCGKMFTLNCLLVSL